MAETSYENVALDHPEFALLNIDLFVDSASSPLPMTGRSFVAAAPETCKEFVRCRNLKPLKIALVSPPGLEEGTLKRANELKAKYSLPLLTRRACVDILLKSEAEEVGPVKAELEAILNTEEGGKDITKLPDPLLAKAFRFCLASGTCMTHGYVMCDFPESENDAFVMFSDEPPPPEPSEEDEKEEEPPKKEEKKKDKKGGSPLEEEVVIAPVVEFLLNPER